MTETYLPTSRERYASQINNIITFFRAINRLLFLIQSFMRQSFLCKTNKSPGIYKLN